MILKLPYFGLDQTMTFKGRFEDLHVLAPTFEFKKAALINFDCDLYHSTIPVLNFMTNNLQNGTIMFFDDWKCFGNSPDRGEQKATAEWLSLNPQIRLVEYADQGPAGKSFTVRL